MGRRREPEAWVVRGEPWGHRPKQAVWVGRPQRVLEAWEDCREAKVDWEHPPVARVVP